MQLLNETNLQCQHLFCLLFDSRFLPHSRELSKLDEKFYARVNRDGWRKTRKRRSHDWAANSCCNVLVHRSLFAHHSSALELLDLHKFFPGESALCDFSATRLIISAMPMVSPAVATFSQSPMAKSSNFLTTVTQNKWNASSSREAVC